MGWTISIIARSYGMNLPMHSWSQAKKTAEGMTKKRWGRVISISLGGLAWTVPQWHVALKTKWIGIGRDVEEGIGLDKSVAIECNRQWWELLNYSMYFEVFLHVRSFDFCYVNVCILYYRIPHIPETCLSFRFFTSFISSKSLGKNQFQSKQFSHSRNPCFLRQLD